MINITKCYETWDHAAIKTGETANKGFEFKDVPHTFLELVRELRLNFRGGELSDTGPLSTDSWIRTNYYLPSTRDNEERTLHYSHNNHPRSEKYWIKALKVAGFR